MEHSENRPETFRTKLDAAGRLLIPASSRHRLGLEQGDEVIIAVDDRGIHITTPERALKEAQDYLAKFVKPGESVVAELIRERREEATRE